LEHQVQVDDDYIQKFPSYCYDHPWSCYYSIVVCYNCWKEGWWKISSLLKKRLLGFEFMLEKQKVVCGMI